MRFEDEPTDGPDWEHIPRDEAARTRELAREGGIGLASDQSQPGVKTGWDAVRWPLILFLATCVSTFYVGGVSYARQVGENAGIFGKAFFTGGLMYAGAILTILLCHEFGHYILARMYRVAASLPYFIPMPFSPLGTMGAVISMGGRIPNRKALFDIGICGPLAGLGPAIAFSWIGLQYSELKPMVMKPGEPIFFMMPLFRFLAHLRFGEIPPNMMVSDHPFALAGWAGIFVTALNLIPIGQLDGGHILYAILRQWSYPITSLLLYGALAVMVLTGNFTWMLLIMLLLISGPNHPPTHDDRQPLGRGRTILGLVTLCFIFVGFTPVPLAFAP